MPEADRERPPPVVALRAHAYIPRLSGLNPAEAPDPAGRLKLFALRGKAPRGEKTLFEEFSSQSV
jgi:hypothetical protein